MLQLQNKISILQKEVDQALERINVTKLSNELEAIRKAMAEPDFWQNQVAAQEMSKKEANLSRRLEPWQRLQKNLNELIDMAGLNDQTMLEELEVQANQITSELEQLKGELKFQGPYDDHDVIISIYAGAGGTDAQDWASMLLRMYIRWAEEQKAEVKTIEQTSGEEAGIKSATIELSGEPYLYGKLAGEHGIHRLVRLSPFNADNLRQTSFARVDVLPKIDKPGEVEIDEKDIKIDVYRAGGHGGQSVNTTDSAVRVTHLPTGITVAIQNERSQLQNKETALSILRSRLATLQLEQHTSQVSELKGPAKSAEWGNQIRSYVLHPYKQVKDLRTGYESSDPEKVLDGNLAPLIESWLEHSLAS